MKWSEPLGIWLKEDDILEIIVAKTAGFCFGVDRALKKVYDNLGERPMYTYGPLIHNHQVVEELSEKGVQVIDDLNRLKDLPMGDIVVRSHGVSEEELAIMKASGFNVIDTTCPFVGRIHKIVTKASHEGRQILILGSPTHAEIRGIAGWSKVPVHYIETLEAAEKFQPEPEVTYALVAQTTFHLALYKEIVSALQKRNIRVIINETICSATEERQDEALEIAFRADLMIVIGGKHSSNTRKLYEICKRQCEDTYHIESIEELELGALGGHKVIGITAGASTPKKLIEEVISNVRNAK